MRPLEELIYIQLIVGVQDFIRSQEETTKIQISAEHRREWAEQACFLARYYADVWKETTPET
jgi:hypothetical protein